MSEEELASKKQQRNNELFAIQAEIRSLICFMEMEHQSAARELSLGGWQSDHQGTLNEMNKELNRLIAKHENRRTWSYE